MNAVSAAHPSDFEVLSSLVGTGRITAQIPQMFVALSAEDDATAATR